MWVSNEKRYYEKSLRTKRRAEAIDKAEEMGCKVVIVDTGGYGIAEIVQGEEGYSDFFTIAKVSWTYNDGQFGECNKKIKKNNIALNFLGMNSF